MATGLSASDAGGFAAGGTMSFCAQGAGRADRQDRARSTLTGSRFDRQCGHCAQHRLRRRREFHACQRRHAQRDAIREPIPNYKLNVTGDSTSRGTTGLSFTQLFGIGTDARPPRRRRASPSIRPSQPPRNTWPLHKPIFRAPSPATPSSPRATPAGLLALQSVSPTPSRPSPRPAGWRRRPRRSATTPPASIRTSPCAARRPRPTTLRRPTG